MLAQNTIAAVADVINLLLGVYSWIIVARALVSWVDASPYNPIVSFLYSATEPVLERARRVIPMIWGMDFSPIAVLLLIFVIRRVLVQTLYQISAHGF